MANTGLASVNALPAVLTAARLYLNGTDELGVATVALPTLEFETQDLKGFGMLGTASIPVKGSFGPLEMTVTWLSLNKSNLRVMAGEAQTIEIRASMQYYDAGVGKNIDKPIRLYIQAIPKSLELGTFENAAQMTHPQAFECLVIEAWVDDRRLVMLDKINYVYEVNGVDMLANVRANLGLA